MHISPNVRYLIDTLVAILVYRWSVRRYDRKDRERAEQLEAFYEANRRNESVYTQSRALWDELEYVRYMIRGGHNYQSHTKRRLQRLRCLVQVVKGKISKLAHRYGNQSICEEALSEIEAL